MGRTKRYQGAGGGFLMEGVDSQKLSMVVRTIRPDLFPSSMHELWWEILRSGIDDLFSGWPVLRERAMLWINGCPAPMPFSSVCGALGLNESWVRRTLIQIHPQALTPPRTEEKESK